MWIFERFFLDSLLGFQKGLLQEFLLENLRLSPKVFQEITLKISPRSYYSVYFFFFHFSRWLHPKIPTAVYPWISIFLLSLNFFERLLMEFVRYCSKDLL